MPSLTSLAKKDILGKRESWYKKIYPGKDLMAMTKKKHKKHKKGHEKWQS